MRSITSFALYGFPESHAASFALIAYSSAYLRAHHPAAFCAAILNCWPMGFYHPATIIKDTQRHGVDVLPVDITISNWKCTWENGAVRMGLRYVRGLRESTGSAHRGRAAKRPVHEHRRSPAPLPVARGSDHEAGSCRSTRALRAVAPVRALAGRASRETGRATVRIGAPAPCRRSAGSPACA